MPMIRKIPSSVLSPIRKKYDLTHMVLWAKSDEGQYFLSSGSNSDNTIQAILMGNKFKNCLGWPDSSMPTPTKLADMIVENHKLKVEIERLRKLIETNETTENESNT
jgi:hypothetical protein